MDIYVKDEHYTILIHNHSWLKCKKLLLFVNMF